MTSADDFARQIAATLAARYYERLEGIGTSYRPEPRREDIAILTAMVRERDAERDAKEAATLRGIVAASAAAARTRAVDLAALLAPLLRGEEAIDAALDAALY